MMTERLQAPSGPLILHPHANDGSLFLDLVRYLASLAVCFGHAISFFGVLDGWRAPRFPYMQNIGVLVFFVLSGFLIGHTLSVNSAKPGYHLGDYLIDRISRIYSGYLPALIVIVLMDHYLVHVGKYEFGAYLTRAGFIGNVFMVQNYLGPFQSYLSVPSLGSGGPLWTLSVEFHIYVFVGACFFLSKAKRPLLLIPLVLVSSPMPMLYLFGQVQPGLGVALFALWLMGFAVSFLLRAGFLAGMSVPGLLILAAAALGGWWHSLVPAQEYAPPSYVLLAFLLLLVLSLATRTRLTVGSFRLQKTIRFLADYSFSLYLIHYTVIYAFHQLWKGSPLAGMWVSVIVSNVAALLLALATEMHHKRLARWLKRLILRRKPEALHPAPSSPQ